MLFSEANWKKVLLGKPYYFFRNLEKYDKLLKDDADLQSLVDVTQELFPIEILGKVLISFIEVMFSSWPPTIKKAFLNKANFLIFRRCL